MSNLVPKEHIEQLVGIKRHPTIHYGMADSEDGMVYILHSQACRDMMNDLRECPYSVAMDWGIDRAEWIEDRPVVLSILDNYLIGNQDAEM
jgi:hypothetical protein